MKLKFIMISMIAFMLFISLGQAKVTYAETRGIESVNNDISEVEREIIETTDKINSINGQIENTEAFIQQRENEIVLKEKEINELNDEINELNDETIALEESVEARAEVLGNRLRSLQASDGQESYLNVLFNSVDFQDFISNLHASKVIMEADSALIKNLEDDIKQVEENKEIVNLKLKNAEKAKKELKDIIEEKEDKKEELVKNKKKVKHEKENLNKKKDAYVKEGNDIKMLEEKLRLEAIIAAEEKAKNEAKAKRKAAAENNPIESDSLENINSTSEEVFTMEATAYTAECEGCSGVTSIGFDLNDNRHMKVIAVDPSIIPLGSRVWIEGYGEAIAGDTGKDIKGNRIDLHFPTESSALAFGRKNVTVKVLN